MERYVQIPKRVYDQLKHESGSGKDDAQALLVSEPLKAGTSQQQQDFLDLVVVLGRKTLQQQQLIETARHLTSSLDVNEVLTRIASGATRILGALTCAIYRLERDGETLTPLVAIDPLYEQETLATPLQVESSFTGQAVRAGRGLIFNDAGVDDSGYQIPGTPENEEEHIIVAPFVTGQEVLGAICLNREEKRFSAEDLSLVETFAAYAATALKNAQAHRDLQREVEEHRKTEAVLRDTEERYRTTIDAMEDALYVVDRDLRIVLCNRTLRQTLREAGYNVEPLGKHICDAFPFLSPDTYQEYEQVFTRAAPLETNDVLNVGGRTYWTDTRKIPIFDDAGSVHWIVTIVRDLTERKQMDMALGYRLTLEELVAAVSTRFIHVGSDGVENEIRYALQTMGEFARVDRCYLHLFSQDLSKIERAYEWSAEGIEPREAAIVGLSTDHMRWALEKKQGQETVHVPRVADLPPETGPAREMWLAEGIQSILSIPLILEDAVIGALGFHSLRSEKRWQEEDIRLLKLVGNILTNVLARQRTEEEKGDLEQRLERARLMESLGLLAGGVAHDLNNLLGPLVSYPELILMDLEEDSPCREDILRIQEAAEKAASVVQDLLTLARRGAYRMSPLYLNPIVQEYLRSPSFTDLKARYQDVSIDVDLKADLPILGSGPHLSKAIMNLVANACEAMPEGGELAIHTFCRSLDRSYSGYEDIEAGDYVVLCVRDTGLGISEQDQARIFEPFYSKKELGRSGSGLGLSVVRGVVQDHQGRIDLESRVGEGTSFWVYLPITTDVPIDTSEASADYGGDEAVLVVDDLQAQRELARRLLSALGYSVHTVASGRAAVAYLQRHRADLVILDMIMEDDFDGLDTYREITRIRPDQKAVIASGFSETDRVKAAQGMGVGTFLRKPYTLQRLGRAVREELDGGPHRKSAPSRTI